MSVKTIITVGIVAIIILMGIKSYMRRQSLQEMQATLQRNHSKTEPVETNNPQKTSDLSTSAEVPALRKRRYQARQSAPMPEDTGKPLDGRQYRLNDSAPGIIAVRTSKGILYGDFDNLERVNCGKTNCIVFPNGQEVEIGPDLYHVLTARLQGRPPSPARLGEEQIDFSK